MSRPLSLSALTVLELSPPDMVTCARDAGYSHVSLRLIPATPTEVSWPTIGDTPLVREIVARTRDTGIAVLDVEILRLQPQTEVASFEAVLATAARLGAGNALVADNDPDPSRFIDNFAALCDLAAPFGIAPCLEPMPWTEAKTFHRGVELVRAVGRDNAGVLIDPLHFDRGGGEAAQIREAPPSFLRYIQMCDAPAERPTDVAELLRQARSDRLLPGEGGLDLTGILRNVPPGTPISLEVPQDSIARTVPAVERARRALEATQRLLARVALDP